MCEKSIKKRLEDLNQVSPGVPCVSPTIFDDTSMRKYTGRGDFLLRPSRILTALKEGYSDDDDVFIR
jgi:hypothetical protein